MELIKTKNLKGDIFGGITAGIVALPLALAFGIQAFGGVSSPQAASIGALAGIVGATLLGFFASMLGGTHAQISGPTGPLTVITSSLLSGVWASTHGNLSAVIITMSLSGLFCGLFQILFGVIKIGKYIRYIPYPVLSGFMSGIGVIIILQQIYPLIGLKSPVLIVDMISEFPQHVSNGISTTALLLGIGTIAAIKFFPFVTKKIPATLIALVLMTVVSLFTNIGSELTIGDIPSGLPMPFFTKTDMAGLNWHALIMSAIIPGLTLAGLGAIDTLMTSVVADNLTKTKHKSNRELIAQGIGNLMTGLFGGIAGSGATMRTVINVKSGGRTQLSGMIHAVLLLSILLGLGSLVKYVPLSVLAGILITIGLAIIDFKGFRDIRKIPKADAFVLLVVFTTTVLVDLLTAVAIGMVIACVLFMKRISDLSESRYVVIDGSSADSPWSEEETIPEDKKHDIYIQRFQSPIFFGSVTSFNTMISKVPSDAKVVVMSMKNVDFMDQSGVYAIETAIKELQERGILVLMAKISTQPLYLMQKMKIIPHLIPEENTFKTIEECTEFVKRLDL